MTNTRRQRGNRGGVVLGLTGIALIAFMGMAVVAIDFGHLGFSTNEVQIVADTAARAGARALLMNRNAMAEVENVVTVAQSVVGENWLDGAAGTISAQNVIEGTYDFQSNIFAPGGADPNAVRAIGEATVANMVAGVFGDTETDVTRDAIAAYSSLGSAQPPCPIAVGTCFFEAYRDSGNCSSLPELTQTPSTTDNSGWTGLFSGANAMNMDDYLPAACGGGGQTPPVVRVGDTITLSNGQVNSLFKTLEDCFDAGLVTECVVPIVDRGCGTQFNQNTMVLGFASFTITDVNTMGSPKYMSIDGFCETDQQGAPGGSDYGTQIVRMVD